MFKVVINDKIVVIVRTSDNQGMYRIHRELLPKKIGNVSRWIRQLQEKSWVDIATLYELATVIQQLYPNNDIDWFRTFIPVETGEYLGLRKTSTAEGKSGADTIRDFIDFGLENHEEAHQRSEVVVRSNLKKYHLPFKEQ